MDPFDLINDLRQNQYIEHEFSTPTGLPTSPFSPPSNATDKDIVARIKRADKERRFHKYMVLNNVRAIDVAQGQRGDADDFYNLVDNGSQSDVIYSKFSNSGTAPSQLEAESEAAILRAYDVYDVHKKQELNSDLFARTTPQTAMYDDELKLQLIMHCDNAPDFESMQFKNNLVESYGDYLFFGSNSKIIVVKNHRSLIRTVDIQPNFTTRRDRSAATWSYFPHTINFIKVSKLADRDVLSCAVDDGRVLVYDIHDFFIDGAHSAPKYELRLSSSVWGVDTYKNMLIVSDNSQTVTLFLFEGNEIYYCTSNQLIHNIPDVTFIDSNDLEEENAVLASCVSISGELIIFRFDLIINYGPVNKPPDSYTVTMDVIDVYVPHFSKYEFSCTILSRAVLQEDVWSVHYIDDKYFKEVNTPKYLGSKNTVDIERILRNSMALNLLSNHLLSSDLGSGAWYEEINVATPQERGVETDMNFNKFTDKFGRVKKSYLNVPNDEMTSPIPKSPFHDKFLFVSTGTKIALYRFDKLVCNATSGVLFDYPMREELRYSNRLSITKFIPELSAIIAVSQAGFVAIYRLVKHRGLHSMRFEHVIPKKEINSFETIIGLGIRRIEESVYWLYLAFSGGGTYVYQLEDPDDSEYLSGTIL